MSVIATLALALSVSVTPTTFYAANLPPNTAYVIRVDDTSGGSTLLRMHTWYSPVSVFTVSADAGYIVTIIPAADTTVTDIRPPRHDEFVRAYPNPTNGTLVIEAPRYALGEFVLYDVHGQEMLRRDIGTRVYVLDLSSLPTGVYFYRCRDTMGKIVLLK